MLKDIQKARAAMDWDAEKHWWLDQLQKLYGQIELWLRPLVTQELVFVDRGDVQITEEHLGSYIAPALILEFGEEEESVIVLRPRGTVIVGARGRVDVYPRGNPQRKSVLTLNNDTQSPSWSIRTTFPVPLGQPAALDQRTFETIVEQLLPSA